MLRALALSLALLIGIGTLIPLATEFAEAGPRKHRRYKKPKVKKYSKRWWKNYNRQKRARHARLIRKRNARIRLARSARLRRARAARARRTNQVAKKNRNYSKSRSRAKRRSNKTATSRDSYTRSVVSKQPLVASPVPAVLPSGEPAPKSWKSEGVAQGEMMFQINDNGGLPVGSASIAVVGAASDESAAYTNRAKTVGGVATTALRRTVIDQMIKENGWVVNDYQKEVGGQQVYVVVAQAPGANNQVENRMFYFTEVEGKIYSVATKAPDKGSERLEEESEKVINSLQRRNAPAPQVASNRTVSNLVANEE